MRKRELASLDSNLRQSAFSALGILVCYFGAGTTSQYALVSEFLSCLELE